MRILVAIVHHWNPNGSGRHASLRPNPHPRKCGLQDQLLALRRLGTLQGNLDFVSLSVQPVNHSLGNVFDIRVITDGKNSVIDQLDDPYKNLFQEVVREPVDGLHLGFEVQKYLASQLNEGYHLYCYMEDDLIIHDPMFFRKICWFNQELGDEKLLLPHRMEFSTRPNRIDKLYIDGSMPEKDLRAVIPKPPKPFVAGTPAGEILYESPRNPHAGCFFLTHSQLTSWTEQSWWQDGDTSYVSPLESAATLGLTKSFDIYKPAFSHAAWLELQHWGTSFICQIHPQANEANTKSRKVKDDDYSGS